MLHVIDEEGCAISGPLIARAAGFSFRLRKNLFSISTKKNKEEFFSCSTSQNDSQFCT